MLRKLFAIVSKSCATDNPDSPQHQEVLLPGQLYGMILKEKIEDLLNGIRLQIITDLRRAESTVDFFNGQSSSVGLFIVNILTRRTQRSTSREYSLA